MVSNSREIYYYYDESGAPLGLNWNNTDYYYYKNIFGDVLGIMDANGTMVVYYVYDAWGNPISTTGSMANTLGKDNPFRYRGYYYDVETGLYYLQARYYNPQWGRFISPDPVLDTTSAIGCNMYAYCGNDPVNRVDPTGHFWDIVWDVVSIAWGIADVIMNYDDIWAWIGLCFDLIDLIPFVTCVGDAIRGVRIADKAIDAAGAVHKTGKAAEAVRETVDTTLSVAKKIDVPTQKIHGNSLNCEKINYGYALTTKDGTIKKFGETINPKNRYSKSFLEQRGLEMNILTSGSKRDIHLWQHDMNEYYRYKYGSYPPMNRRGW